MKKTPVLLGCLFLLIAVIIFIFADGARRWYSGLFFVILGVGMFVNPFFRAKK